MIHNNLIISHVMFVSRSETPDTILLLQFELN